jgi:Peptidase M16 inactive domain.
MLYDAYFYIGAEVNRENLDQVLIEIEREIEKLKTEPIRDEELTMLKKLLVRNAIKHGRWPLLYSSNSTFFLLL